MMVANVFPPIAIAIAQVDNVFYNYDYPREITFFAVAYLLYYSLWLFGNNRFINEVIVLPEESRGRIKRANQLINAQIIIAQILVPITIFSTLTVSRIAFLLTSQIAILSFAYFYRSISREQSLTTSMLTKSRMFLLKRTVLFQIMISLTILFGLLSLLLFATDKQIEGWIELVLFAFYNTFAILSSIYINFSFYIPSFVREKFNLGSERFLKFYEMMQLRPEE